MRIYTRYKNLRSRRSISGWLYGIFALLALGLLGWLWWQAAQPPELKPAPKLRARTSPTATPTNWSRALVMAPRAMPSPVITTSNPPPVVPEVARRMAQNIFELQLALARLGISCGPLDGVFGSQTHAALRAFQRRDRLPVTGELDPQTKARLNLSAPTFANYTVTGEDLARLRPLSPTWLGKSRQERLDFESILELVAEKAHAHPNLIRRLNPDIDWGNVVAGTTIKIPSAEYPASGAKAAFLRIHLADKTLEAFDANSNLLAHFPCSIAQRVEKRPVGQLHVAVIAHNPNYRFDPAIFPESAEGRRLGRPLMIPPGPNNPVGTAWIGLDKPGYGIHGTPRPEEVGRTESHGCFRLANWNAEYLAQLVWLGMPVNVEP